MVYKVLDIFSGAGGMSHGVAQAGFEIVEAVDLNADALASLKLNHPKTLIERKAVSVLNFTVPALFTWQLSRPDVIVGGPPCQAYSDAGKRDKNDPRAVVTMTSRSCFGNSSLLLSSSRTSTAC